MFSHLSSLLIMKFSIKILYQERFSDPNLLVNDLHLNGFKAIWMLDPGIKQEKGYFVYDSGSESDVWIKTADGKPFVGKDFASVYLVLATRGISDTSVMQELSSLLVF